MLKRQPPFQRLPFQSFRCCFLVNRKFLLDIRFPWHQLLQFLMCWRFLQIWQLRQKVIQILIRIHSIDFGGFHQRIHNGAGFSTFYTVAEQPVFLPRTKGRTAFSARLLETGTSPWSRNAINCSCWFREYRTASSNLLPFSGLSVFSQ